MELKIIPVIQVLIAASVMIVIQFTTPNFHYFFAFNQLIAMSLLTVAFIIGVLAIYCFKVHQTTVNPISIEKTSKVVDTGIYRYSRNPMYLAMLLALFALAVYLSHWLTWLVLPFFIVYITRYQIIPEERSLRNNFGQDYLLYTNKVRRWL